MDNISLVVRHLRKELERAKNEVERYVSSGSSRNASGCDAVSLPTSKSRSWQRAYPKGTHQRPQPRFGRCGWVLLYKRTRIGLFIVDCAIALLIVPIVGAQLASPAPVPVQIVTSKRAFISNGDSTIEKAPANLAYNEFYADMKSWGKYELVAAPADADLIFEIRLVAAGGPFFGNPEHALRLALVILDPKTHAVLWTVSEPMRGAGFESNARKNFDQGMATLMGKVKKLTARPAPSVDTPDPNK